MLLFVERLLRELERVRQYQYRRTAPTRCNDRDQHEAANNEWNVAKERVRKVERMKAQVATTARETFWGLKSGQW